MRKTAVLAGLVTAAVVAIGAAVVHAQPYGPGWMMGGGFSGYGPGWMMRSGYGPGGGYGPGMMGGPGWGGGPGWMHGGGRAYSRDLTADSVKARIEERMLNPRLKVGEVTQTDDTITATIVTKDKDVLVQKFSIDRKNGSWRPEND
jgi:Spy/CpxP family protein refolding chaperone